MAYDMPPVHRLTWSGAETSTCAALTTAACWPGRPMFLFHQHPTTTHPSLFPYAALPCSTISLLYAAVLP